VGDRVGVGPVTKQVVKSNDPLGGQGLVCVRDMTRVGVKHRMAEVRLLCYRWLSLFLKLKLRIWEQETRKAQRLCVFL
jgi:hypothetical protein